MLDRKLFRDLKRLWAQALVVAGSAATLATAVGSPAPIRIEQRVRFPLISLNAA
jgi:hypothetical protein